MESLLWACDIFAMLILVSWSVRRESAPMKGARNDLSK